MNRYSPDSYKTYVHDFYDFGTSKSLDFHAQKTRFTCGCACLTSISKLFGINLDEMHLARILNTKGFPVGTCHDAMTKWAMKNIPTLSHGEDSYKGGLAIANIKNQVSGYGHYVVLLGQRGNYIRYFCPRIAKTVITHKDDLDWQNSDGSLKNWSINFDYNEDLFTTPVIPSSSRSFFENAIAV